MKQRNIISRLFSAVLIVIMGAWGYGAYAQVASTDYGYSFSKSTTVRPYDKEESEKVFSKNPPLGVKYTKKHPLVIVGNWSFKPYSFFNDYGKPDGFLVDVLHDIFDRLHIPYTLQLMDWKVAKQMVRDGRAQLMVGIDKNDITPHTGYSKSVIAEYKVGVMHRKEIPRLRSILLLTEKDTIHIMKGDYIDSYLKQYFGSEPPFHIEYLKANEALQSVYTGKVKYFVWGMLPLNNMVKIFGEEDELRVDDIDIPAGNMRMFSNDSILLHELDIQFQHISSMRMNEPLYRKWFENEGKKDARASVTQITFIVLGVIIIVMLIIILIVVHRGGGAVNLKAEFRAISRMAIDMTQCDVLCIELNKMWVKNISGTMMPEKGLSVHDYEMLIHPDDIQKEYDIRKRVDDGETDMPVLTLRIRREIDGKPEWRLMNVTAFIQQNSSGTPKRIYLVFTDETEHMAEQLRLDMSLRELGNITQITELGMLYYDVTGKFVNCNKTIINIFNKGNLGRAEQFFRNSKLSDFTVIFNGIVVEQEMDTWFCAPVDIPELNLRLTTEVRIQCVYGDNGAVDGYEICIIDIGETKKLHNSQQALRQRLVDAKRTLTRYHMELRFILRHNKITTFRWKRGNDFFEISHDLLSFYRRVSFKNSIDTIVSDEKTILNEARNNPDEYFSKPHEDTFCFKNPAEPDQYKWLKVFVIPDYDKQGNLIGAFGIQYDITDAQQTFNNLRKETEKAENSGKQKTIFLSNMTHELRTPLNAINGFAEVMQYMDTPEERDEYITIMRHNCTMLINLIDNILQLSVMDTDGVKLHTRDVDFAHLFPASVFEMKKYFTSPDVKLQIDTPLSTLPVNMDYERVMQVVDAFVNNAAKFTKKGFVRVGYRYVDGVLTIYCRDTGCGIPENRQKDVFERFIKLNDFVQGTGLGLAVSKIIAEKMGATIDLYSREGEGTNLSFNLTCHSEKENN